MIKVIIFDLGGVLTTPAFKPFSAKLESLYHIPKERVEATLRKHWAPFLLGQMKESEYWKRFANDLGIEYAPRKFGEIILSFFILNDGLVKLIKNLKKGHKIVLLSNISREWMEHIKEEHQLGQLFDLILTSYQFGSAKPRDVKSEDSTEIYRASLEKVDSKPAECVFVDDHEENLEPAKLLGMNTILFRNTEQLKSELVRLGIELR